MAKHLLAYPALHNLEMDSDAWFLAQRKILLDKKFLHKIHSDLYDQIGQFLPVPARLVVELGSGAGFIDEAIPRALRTDVFFHPFVDLVMDGARLPFPDGAVDALVMVDVFHHIPDTKGFLRNSLRVLRSGGRIVMIEPWVSDWSKLVYSRLHSEPLNWRAREWSFVSSGPVSGANQALAWIVFQRDRQVFEREFPDLEVIKIQPMMPFRYLLSGGVSSRLGLPGFLYASVKQFERLVEKNIKKWAMFGLVVLEKVR